MGWNKDIHILILILIETYTNTDIKFKTTMLRFSLCEYADAYILVKGIITITGAVDDDAAKRLDERKGVIFKTWAPFTKCISRINNTDIDTARDIDTVMPMYNLIEYSDEVFGNTIKMILLIT